MGRQSSTSGPPPSSSTPTSAGTPGQRGRLDSTDPPLAKKVKTAGTPSTTPEQNPLDKVHTVVAMIEYVMEDVLLLTVIS